MAFQVKWYKIFESQSVASATVPPGKLQLIKIGNHRICMAHTEQGFYAVGDTCTHLSASLSKGHANYLNQVICPWHSYRFDLETGQECQQRALELETYPIEIRDNGFYLGVKIPS